jgi:hypothetical protein
MERRFGLWVILGRIRARLARHDRALCEGPHRHARGDRSTLAGSGFAAAAAATGIGRGTCYGLAAGRRRERGQRRERETTAIRAAGSPRPRRSQAHHPNPSGSAARPTVGAPAKRQTGSRSLATPQPARPARVSLPTVPAHRIRSHSQPHPGRAALPATSAAAVPRAACRVPVQPQQSRLLRDNLGDTFLTLIVARQTPDRGRAWPFWERNARRKRCHTFS